MCTKESKVIAKTKKCGCGEPRPESSIHIHTDFPLHDPQNAIVAPDTADNAYYFDPFNEIDDFNIKAHTLLTKQERNLLKLPLRDFSHYFNSLQESKVEDKQSRM